MSRELASILKDMAVRYTNKRQYFRYSFADKALTCSDFLNLLNVFATLGIIKFASLLVVTSRDISRSGLMLFEKIHRISRFLSLIVGDFNVFLVNPSSFFSQPD